MDQNRKFAEMNGLCWHKWIRNDGPFTRVEYRCMYCAQGVDYTQNMEDGMDFSDPREVLKVVMEREQGYWHDFSRSLWVKVFSTVTANHLDHFYQIEIMIEKSVPIDYITTPGKLRDAWISWMENNK
jgi:hypothetical protein